MIVYGDPQYEESLATLAGGLHQRITALLDAHGKGNAEDGLQRLRAALILAGQLEQAAYDSFARPEQQVYNNRLREVTACLGMAFYAAWAEQNGIEPAGDTDPPASLARARATLAGWPELPGAHLQVKVPEGFAFYTLYPDQYCAAALGWLADHGASRSETAVVVGIRSIGTTLAAAVAATLRAHGWRVTSLTVRPTGHPFSREAQISAEQVAGTEWGLVVDEGPGLSGSSMPAVGQALARAGVPREKISFFPAHANGPGSAASGEVRDWWSATPKHAVPLRELSFGGLPLPESLAAWLASRYESDPVVRIEDVSGGQWRKLLYADSSAWPATCAPFERTKYLLTTRSGRRALFKFEGLCGAPGTSETTAEAVESLLAERAAGGWTPRPLGQVNGFVATEWAEGQPLRMEDCSLEMLRHMGRYIAAVSGPQLNAEQYEAGTERLAEMLYWNTWEALGEEVAERTRPWADALRHMGCNCRSYGDGRMAPHEWIRTHGGKILKADSAGHAWDHTCIGPQPVAWDVAGAIVEWGLGEDAEGTLLEAFYSAGGEPIPAPTLAFYRVAYAAFRAGQCHLCANMSAHDPAEQERLWSAYNRYKGQLAALL